MVSARLRSFSCLLTVTLLLLLPAASVDAVNDQQESYAQDRVVIAVNDLPLFFSPYASSPLDLQYAHLFFDPLVRWGTKHQLEKRLLQQWKSIKPGVTRFYLKKNIKFHSGNKLHSADVIWTFTQILKEPQARLFFEEIKAIKRVDPYSFDVYSALSQAQLLDYFTHFFVLDAAFYQLNKIDVNKAQAAVSAQQQELLISGTGPYRIKRYNSMLSLDVISNKGYWQGQPAIKELNFIKIQRADSRSFALLADDVDISESVANNMIATISFAPSKSLIEVFSPDVIFFTINDRRSALFKRPEIRDAINLTINKEGMLKHIINGMGSVGSVYTPFKDAEKEISHSQQPTYDVARAKKLLGRVKMPAELTLLVLVDQTGNTPQVAKALLNMMKRVGIKLFITEVSDLAEWNKRLLNYDFTLSVWHSPLMNSDNVYHDLFDGSVLSAYLKALFSKENPGASVKKQAELFEQMQRTHQIIPLLFQNKIWATDEKYNLPAIFSVNGIPYWQLLTRK